MARDYEPVPTQPDEQWVVLYYAEKLPKDPKDRRAVRPELSVVWIDWVPDVGPTTPDSGAGSPPAPQPGPPPPSAGPETPAAPSAPPLPPLNSIERYVERQMPGWALGRAQAGKQRGELQAQEAPLAGGRGNMRGWVYWWKTPARTIALVGHCADADYEEQTKIWRNIGERIVITEPEGEDLAELQRMYERSNLRGADFRIHTRSKLVRGWKAEDTENFIVIYDTKDQPLIRLIKSELEAIREEYVKLFPPAKPVEAVSAVRICKDAAEYFQYGGPNNSGGYWNYRTEELVFYDYDNAGGKAGTGKANSRIVLYHEAFHQFIYYSVGEIAPHSWFNEGSGDYFSGAVIKGGKVKKIGVNPWRCGYIQEAMRRGMELPWAEILAFEQPEYYRPDRVGLCYAQGWSMIYFLRQAKEVQRRPEWAKILPTYFDTLKLAWAEEEASVQPGSGDEAAKSRYEAQKRSRERALAAAIEGVDLYEIEKAWKKFTLALDDPAED